MNLDYGVYINLNEDPRAFVGRYSTYLREVFEYKKLEQKYYEKCFTRFKGKFAKFKYEPKPLSTLPFYNYIFKNSGTILQYLSRRSADILRKFASIDPKKILALHLKRRKAQEVLIRLNS